MVEMVLLGNGREGCWMTKPCIESERWILSDWTSLDCVDFGHSRKRVVWRRSCCAILEEGF